MITHRALFHPCKKQHPIQAEIFSRWLDASSGWLTVPAIFMTHTIVIHHQLSNHGRGSSISPAGIHMILEFLRLCLVMVSCKGEAICKDGTSSQDANLFYLRSVTR